MRHFVTRAEQLWLAGAILIILGLSSVPYYVGHRLTTPDTVFSGAVYDRLDYSTYLASMERAREGDWRFRLLFTSEPQKGAYVKLPYVALGHLAGWLDWSNVAVFHLARLIFGALALGLIYFLVSVSFTSIPIRRFVFVFAVLGSGLAWLQTITGWIPVPDISPIDFWLIDAYVFFGILSFPHFAAAIACLVGIYLGYVLFVQNGSTGYIAASLTCAVLLQAINPYYPLIADVAAVGYCITLWSSRRKFPVRGIVGLVLLAICQLPLLGYNFIVFLSDPIFRGFAEQNLTLSPPVVYYLWGFGFFWVLLVPGAIVGVRRDVPPVFGGFYIWIATGVVLSLLPSVIQRRFLFAITIPLAVVSGLGVEKALLPWFRLRVQWAYRRRWLFSQVFLVFASLSSLYLVMGMALFYLPSRPVELFDSAATVRTLELLDELAEEDDLVLSRADTGRIVAEKTGLTVFLGHPIETLNYKAKVDWVDRYFAGQLDAAWIRDQGVQWVFLRPSDGEIADPAVAGLQLVVEQEGARLFRVLP